MNKWFKHFTRSLLATAVVFAGALTAATVRTEAASVRNLTQTNKGTHSADISWTIDEDRYPNQGFQIFVGENSSNAKVVATVSSSTTSYTINDLADGKKYYTQVQPIGRSTYAYLFNLETLPESVKNFHQEKWWYIIKKLDVAWDRIDTADAIEVKLYNSKGKNVATQTLRGGYTRTSFAKMKDEVYTVTVRAAKDGHWTPVSTIRCFNQARIKSLKASKGKLKMKWGKVGGATGYDIYVSTNPKSGYKKVKSVGKGKSSFTLKKFKGKKINPKKNYYVVVETKKGSSKSGMLYYWQSKSGRYGYIL